MYPDPFPGTVREPTSLLNSATRWTALLPYLDLSFRATVDHSNLNGTLGTLKIELYRPANAEPLSRTTQMLAAAVNENRYGASIKSLLSPPSQLSIEYRRAQRYWYSTIMQWGNKHDTVIKLATDVGYQIYVRDLVFRDNMTIDDRQTALDIVTFAPRLCRVSASPDATPDHVNAPHRHSYPPEEIRITLAALHCIDEYFLLVNKGSQLSCQSTVLQAANFIVTVHHLWQGSSLPHEKRRWFRKFAHKGFYDLCYKILKDKEMIHLQLHDVVFKPEVNELLMIYVHTLATDPSHPIVRLIEEKKGLAKPVIAQTLSKSILLRLSNRPAVFVAALQFARRHYGDDRLRELFRSPKIDKRTLIRACEAYNVPFIKAVLHYCELPAICQLLHADLIALCSKSSGTNLLSCIYDTLASASQDLWTRLLSLENFQLFRAASGYLTSSSAGSPTGSLGISPSSHSGIALNSEIMLEGCLPDILKTMILAAKSRRELCQIFVTLCAENAVDLLDVYRRYFPFDLWEDMASYDGFLGPSKAALAGHVGVLEIIRQGFRAEKRALWHALLSQLLDDRIRNACSISMGHYLYFEQELRPHLEHDALMWQAIRANQTDERPLLSLGGRREKRRFDVDQSRAAGRSARAHGSCVDSNPRSGSTPPTSSNQSDDDNK